MTLNGDAGNNYSEEILYGSGASSAAGRQDSIGTFNAAQSTNTANVYSGGLVLFPDAFNAARHKAYVALGGAGEEIAQITTGRYASVSPISRITLTTTNFVAGSVFTLYAVDERYRVAESVLAADGSFSFAGLPAGNDIIAIASLRTDAVAALESTIVSFNEDVTDANYVRERLNGSDATASAATGTDRDLGPSVAVSATAGAFAAALISIPAFSTGANHRHSVSIFGAHDAVVPAAQISARARRWSSTAAITRIDLTVAGNFKAGSGVWLYRAPSVLLARTVLGADQTTLSFSAPSSGYEALGLTIYGRSQAVAAVDNVLVSFNGDATANNYDTQTLNAGTTTVTAAQSTGSRVICEVPASLALANGFGGGSVLIMQPHRTDRHKHLLAMDGSGTISTTIRSTRWESLSAITTIALTAAADFAAGTIVELWGIPSADRLGGGRARKVAIRA